eukprot:gene4262-6586_t
MLQIENVDHVISQDELQDIAERLEGASGSDIKTALADALMEPIRELLETQYWICQSDEQGQHSWKPTTNRDSSALQGCLNDIPAAEVKVRPVTGNDIIKAIETNTRTVDPDEIAQFAAFASTSERCNMYFPKRENLEQDRISDLHCSSPVESQGLSERKDDICGL